MNKIKVIKDKVELFLEDKKINIDINDDTKFFGVKDIIINVLENTSLEIEYKESISKFNITINLNENCSLKLFELNQKEEIKFQYQYNLEKNSTLDIIKFYDVKNIRQKEIINLNGENANINYKLKTISNGNQNFELNVNHNEKNTFSNIYNNGINLNGNIIFNVTGIVPNGMKDSEINQYNQIITFNDNKCIINPKLLIEENDVVANHSALIGKFDEDILFYMQSRGIDYKNATNLLIKGFLLDDIEDERLDKIIEKYWG